MSLFITESVHLGPLFLFVSWAKSVNLFFFNFLKQLDLRLIGSLYCFFFLLLLKMGFFLMKYILIMVSFPSQSFPSSHSIWSAPFLSLIRKQASKG